jgi:hypothetical protein
MQAMQGDWLPARAALHPTGLYLALREIRPAELQDPFMQETIARVPARESVMQIAREDVGKGTAGTEPTGIIYHVARCGSTLVSQLLKQHVGVVVYAEPLPVNEILLPPHKWGRHEVVGALRSLGGAFARHAAKPYVLKLSSWNVLFCDLLAEAFPRSPWVFCFRDPVEVGVSLLDQMPGWLQDAAAGKGVFAGIVDPRGESASAAEFVARLYGAYCDSAARLDARSGRLVPYRSLPRAVWDVVAPHFSIAVSARQREHMAAAAGSDAKAPVGKGRPFVDDSGNKQAKSTADLRGAVARHAAPALDRLTALYPGGDQYC